MKKIYFLSLSAIFMIVAANSAWAQSNYTKQIIVVNGGDFGNPDDYVTVSSYDPETEITTDFGTIYTQSVQSICIHESYAYIAAQDSIVMFNIDTYEKLSSVSAIGVNKLATDGNILIASFWYPVTEKFVRTFSAQDLSPLVEIEGISGDASGILLYEGVALVAIPGPWGSTTGKIVSIDANEGILLSEDDYGEFFANIAYFGMWNNTITTFMTTPWGELNSKSADFDMGGEPLNQVIYENVSLANITGQKGSIIYAEINNGIGSINIENNEVDTLIVAPQDMSIAASVIDTINNLIYLTTSDFFSTGEGKIFNLDGENTGSFSAGISAQAIAVDYRTNTSLNELVSNELVKVYPNPSTSFVNIEIPEELDNYDVIITDISSKIIHESSSMDRLDISSFKTGLYFILIKSKETNFTGKFIKQ